ncbi:MAG: PEP-CTERM sorting domain-containing protein [Verrucomicrobiaceae bacterium]
MKKIFWAVAMVGLAKGQTLVIPGSGNLSVLADTTSQLDLIDGLAFDVNGNLFGALEIDSSSGGVVVIDKVTGQVTSLVDGIPRADQLNFSPNGKLYVTAEVPGASTTDRIYEVEVTYSGGVPVSATKTSLTTTAGINNPEGLAVLQSSGVFGDAGTLLVAEHASPGTIWSINPSTGASTALALGLASGEGMSIGDFSGGGIYGLYIAETGANRVTRVDPDGTKTALGDGTTVSMTNPDNVAFGPDGYVYVSEDVAGTGGRILRANAAGVWEVFATGFNEPQGMLFGADGTMYISEQGEDRIWQVTPVPEPASIALVGLTGLVLLRRKRR